MNSNKKDIHKVLKNSLNLGFRIKAKSPSPEQIEKKLFIDALRMMVEIQDRTEFMVSELGIDTIGYEDKYYRVIESLFKMHFNEQQLSLIQMYLYELKPDKTWDGKIELDLQQGKDPQILDFKYPKDVWEVIKKFKK
tara:strand:+ start:138 stop:548 length:411 start_codon:yes stop_codon:yes gene_type:complete